MTSSLAEQYPIEQARCRELLDVYKTIPTGAFGAAMIEDVLKAADVAAASGDLARMIAAFQRMKDCE